MHIKRLSFRKVTPSNGKNLALQNPSMTMKQCAKWWWDKGFNVIPIQDDKLKKPLCEWKQWQHERQTEKEMMDELTRLGTADIPFNIAVILGTYDGWTRAVTDLDKDDYVDKFHEYFPDLNKNTTLITKPSKGEHIFLKIKYSLPTHHLQAKGVKIDLQCEEAYVVVPRSQHATALDENGARIRYELISNQDAEIAEFEGDLWISLIDFIRNSIDKNFTGADKIHKVADLLRPLRDGEGRNVAGIEFACLLFASLDEMQVPEDEMVAMAHARLVDWNKALIDPMPDEDVEIIFQHATEHRYLYKFDRLLTRDELEAKQPLTPEMEQFLKNPLLVNEFYNLTDTKITGENELRLLIYLLGLGAVIIKRPFGLIIVSTAGGGKSYMEEIMMTAFPRERVEEPTSVSEQVLNYLGKSYAGLIVRIDELFGTEEGMPTIRVWMTNGRLERWITDADTHKALKEIVDGCPVFFTSTTDTIEEQYGSRNWICAITPDKRQTRNIHQQQDAQNGAPVGLLTDKADKAFEFLRCISKWVMQNPVPVVIPFRYKFPYKIERMRREKNKLSNLIKCSAQLFQLQRESFEFRGVRHIIATREDFELAMQITNRFMMSTIHILDTFELRILDWANESCPDSNFSCAKCSKGTDIGNQTVWKRLGAMAKRGYVEAIMEPMGNKVASYKLTDLGRIKDFITIEIYDDGEALTRLYRGLPGTEDELFNSLKQIREGPAYKDEGAEPDPQVELRELKRKGSVSTKEPDPVEQQLEDFAERVKNEKD